MRVGLDLAIVERSARATTAFALGPSREQPERHRRLRLAAAALGVADGSVAWVRQVHGSDLSEVGAADVECVADADGLVTSCTSHALAVWTADCVPMLVAGRSAVAAVHAGWRGCVAGIVERAIERLCDGYAEDPADLDIRLGPAIGMDHYEVGPEVVEALVRHAGGVGAWLGAGSRVDLRVFVRERAIACGARPERVAMVGACTSCDPATASHRRDGALAGRQWSMILRHPVT
jgi:YfiH family protein